MTTTTDGRVIDRAAAAQSTALSRVTLRPIGAPLPMGFLALAVGSFVLAGHQLHWIAAAQQHPLALCLLVFVVPLQATSAVFGLLARDVIAATGMAVLTGTWFAVGVVLRTSPPGQVSGALGLLLIASASALITIAATAILTKPVATAVIGLSGLRFASAGIYQLNDITAWRTTTAMIGLLLSAVAWYAGCALLLEDLAHRPVLPTFRRHQPPPDPQAALAEDTHHIAVEAGVRNPA